MIFISAVTLGELFMFFSWLFIINVMSVFFKANLWLCQVLKWMEMIAAS